MGALEVGTQLVKLCNEGKDSEAVEKFYDEKIVSIEAQGGDGLQQRLEGLEAVLGKHAWWYDNHEVHSSTAMGPFCGHRENQFAVVFELDATFKPTNERQKMTEIAIYTVADDKIVEEEFWYAMG